MTVDDVGASANMALTADGACIVTSVGTLTSLTSDGDITMAATQKLYLDGGGNSYITESSSDMGKFFSGGGLALAGVTLFRVFQRLVTQVGDAFRTLTGIGKISENELLLQKQITGTLASNPAILKKIANGSLTVSQVHKTLLDQIELENKALLLQKRIAEQIAAALHKSGVTVGNTFGELVPPGGSPSVVDHPLMASSRKGHIPKKSKGHIPNFNKRDKEAKRQELAGASYAKSGTRAVIDRMSGLGKYG